MVLKTILISLCLLIIQTAMSAEKIYRWVDEKGKVHYGNQPKNKDAKLINNKHIQSIELVKTKVNLEKVKDLYEFETNKKKYKSEIKDKWNDNKIKCNSLNEDLRKKEEYLDGDRRKVYVFEKYKKMIKALKEQIRKDC